MSRHRLAVLAALAVALATPAAASASITDAEFQALLKQAQPDMPLATETQVHGELPSTSPTPAPVPAVDPAPAAPAPAEPLQSTPAPATQAPAPPKSRKPDGTACRRQGRVRRCETVRGGALASVCVTSRRTRTCTHYRDGRPARRCVRTGGRNHCRTLQRAVGRASTMTWNGWPGTTVNPLGKIVTVDAAGKTWVCSGTMVSRTLMLTAAHCLFDTSYHKKVYFAPGASAAATGSIAMPLGNWEASNWWVPDGYRLNKDNSLDFGLVEIPPAGGRYIGDITGSFSITPNLKWSTGKRVRLMGYPASGFWASAAGFFGNGQYACDANWDEGYSTSGTGYDLWATCTMNGGSSGGPWFALDANNQWTIAGVNSRCYDATGNKCVPKAQYMITSYIDSRFYTFWNNVNAQRRY
jgi:V8-like Glu-specific endopeptidase